MAKTPLQYIRDSGVASTKEIMELSKSDKDGYNTLIRFAREQMANLGVEIEEPKGPTMPTAIAATA
jgi:hypothetical protein